MISVLSLAVFFRFWQIRSLPGGLFPDEAANGIDAIDILHGKIVPFFERGNGREGLFFYLEAFSIWLFGVGVRQLHIVSATIGILEVVALYLLSRRMFNKNIAILSSFFLATSYWHIVLSRTGFRVILVPLFTTLSLYFLVRVFQSDNVREEKCSAMMAGIFFGAGFYSYISYRMLPFVLLALLIIYLWSRFMRKEKIKILLSQYIRSSIIFTISTVIVVAPLGYYFYSHPGSLHGRTDQVSVFSQELNNGDLVGTVIDVAQKTALSFFTSGDLNWRHNVSGQPFLPILLSPFFLIGLLYASWRSIGCIFLKRSGLVYVALLLWFFAMLAPELATAEGIPHGLRLAGVLPVVFIFPALIIERFFNWLKENKFISQLTATIIAIIFVFGVFSESYFLYFNFYANSPDAYYAYRSDLTSASYYLNERNDKENTFLSLDAFSVQTVEFLTFDYEQPYQLVLPERSFETVLKPYQQIIFTQSTLFDITKFVEYHPDAKLVKKEYNKFGEPIMAVYQE